MAASRLRVHRADRPSLDEEPKFFTQLPDDLDEDAQLNARPGPTGILRALLRLIRRSGSKDRSVVCTLGDIAKAAGVSSRSVRTHISRLDRLGYITRTELSASGGQTARKTRFMVTYNLRSDLKLEAEPTTISGSQSASNRKKSSASNRKKSSASNRKKSSAPLTLFERAGEQRYSTEEKNDDVPSPKSVVVVSSDSPRESNPEPTSPIVERIRALWPEEPLIERRAAELAARGDAEALLAIEYAELMKADGLVYAIKTRDRWYRDGYDLADCEAEVKARRPTARSEPIAVAVISKPEPLTPEEIRATIEGIDQMKVPALRRINEMRIREWLDKGLVPDDLIPGAQKAGRGTSRQLSPRPAGTFNSVPTAPDLTPNHKMKGCTRQGTEENGVNGQRARQDSNLQPSDSKSSSSEAPSRLDSSPKTPGDEAPRQEDSQKTRGLSIREFSRNADLRPAPALKPQPTGRPEDA